MIFRQVHNSRYITKIPKDITAVKARFKTGVELMQLKGRARKWTKDNLELRDSLPLLVYSPDTDRYWYRILKHGHDLAPYRRYIRDGNLYIIFDEKWRNIVSEEREKEGMGYYQYNKIRELTLTREILEKKEPTDAIGVQLRAIELEIKKTRNEKD